MWLLVPCPKGLFSTPSGSYAVASPAAECAQDPADSGSLQLVDANEIEIAERGP